VSLGGDIRCDAPPGSSGPGWPVRVTERPGEGPGQTVRLAGGGLATSSTTVRRWGNGGLVRHHIVDPRTGLPTTGPWRTVTATGPTCVAANTASTAALVLGDRAVPWLKGRLVTARLVSDSGAIRTVGAWPRALPTAGAPAPTCSPEEELS
jgi:thiamine biosynthesis lipoprotein